MQELVIVQYGIFADGKSTPAYQVAKYSEEDGAYHSITTTMPLEDAQKYIEKLKEDQLSYGIKCIECGVGVLQCGGWLERVNPVGDMPAQFRCRPKCGVILSPEARVMGAMGGSDHTMSSSLLSERKGE